MRVGEKQDMISLSLHLPIGSKGQKISKVSSYASAKQAICWVAWALGGAEGAQMQAPKEAKGV